VAILPDEGRQKLTVRLVADGLECQRYFREAVCRIFA
jgi:hypothetical protein